MNHEALTDSERHAYAAIAHLLENGFNGKKIAHASILLTFDDCQQVMLTESAAGMPACSIGSAVPAAGQ